MARLVVILIGLGLGPVVACNSGGGGSTSGATGASGTAGGTGTSGLPPAFVLSFTPPSLSISANASQAVTININRDPLDSGVASQDSLAFSLVNDLDGGITVLFAPNPTTATSTRMTLGVAADVPSGSYGLLIEAHDTAAGLYSSASFPLKILAAATTLLVDNDASGNNLNPNDPNQPPSPSDTLFATLLGPAPQGVGLPFATFVLPSDGSGSTTPTLADLESYSAVIWYTGANYGGAQPTMTAAQEAVLESWLDLGGKSLVIFSENLVYDLDGSPAWDQIPSDSLLASVLGAVGADVDGSLNHIDYVASGAFGDFEGQTYFIGKDFPLDSTCDRINPGAGTDALITVMADEAGTGTPQAVPSAVGRKKVGQAGTSTAVYVGMPIENLSVDPDGGSNTTLQLFTNALVYAGLM